MHCFLAVQQACQDGSTGSVDADDADAIQRSHDTSYRTRWVSGVSEACGQQIFGVALDLFNAVCGQMQNCAASSKAL